MRDIVQDVGYGLRVMLKAPGFTAVAVLTLALGIGANTAIFSLINSVMLKSLPVKDPAQLVLLKWTGKKVDQINSGYGSSLSYPIYRQLRAKSQKFSDVFGFAGLGFNSTSVNTSLDGHPGLAAGEMVTGNYFSALGIVPVLGRTLTDSDETSTSGRAAVISSRYWQKLGGSDSILNKTIALNGVPHTIVGVAPTGFNGINPRVAPDVWIPITYSPLLRPWGSRMNLGEETATTSQQWWWLVLMGRLKPGVTANEARAETDVLLNQSIPSQMNPAIREADRLHARLEPAGQGMDMLRRWLKEPFTILMALVGMVLLIACANIATLLLARAAARKKEIGVRLALGASRGRIVRQLLTESVLLAFFGGALGFLLAQWTGHTLLLWLESDPLPLDLQPDATVLAFTAGVSLLTGILFGMAPGFAATRIALTPALNEGRGIAGIARRRFASGKALVVTQVALSLLLLVGAGLFVRTLQKLQAQDFGFDRQNLLVFQLEPTRNGYEGPRLLDFYAQLLQRLQAMPGVQSATALRNSLLSGWKSNQDISIPGYTPPAGEDMMIDVNTVGPDFVRTMGMKLRLGRGIEWRDTSASPYVAVVSENFARRFFGEESPLGRSFRFASIHTARRLPRSQPSAEYQIVGVVADAKYDSARREPRATAFISYTQAPVPVAELHFAVRARGDATALTAAARNIVRELDPDLPLLDVKTQTQLIDEQLTEERMFANLSSFFGMLGLLLACIGLHGTISYSVTRRTSEIGIRMALGAPRGQVLWMVLRQALWLVALGIAVGIPASIAAARVAGSRIAGLLFGLKATDPMTIIGAALIMTAVATLAGYLPARKAARVDPMVALRYE